ncbi:unnamed protein product [Bursaphelenchus xylophilus]|uniref:(pine wood nematode) hypothetical protein n=1 Tax=Bursaphelenchus xylophilus TaxID=6326 RepID=A0A1I7SWF9_BURXY|nr:unnamed protein product [Bursaphelenchus xylophilus]CAG9099354.1 unnamed protein product [Bursaphelenchus xylophilus]
MLSDDQITKEYVKSVVNSVQNECKKMPLHDPSEGPNRDLVAQNLNQIKKLKGNHDKRTSLDQGTSDGHAVCQELRTKEKILNSKLKKTLARLEKVKMVKTAMIEELFATAGGLDTSSFMDFQDKYVINEEEVSAKLEETVSRIEVKEKEFERAMQGVRKDYNMYVEVKKKIEGLPEIGDLTTGIKTLEEKIRKFDVNGDWTTDTLISDHGDMNASHYVE